MTEEHEKIFQKFSIHNEVISIWRPINEEAADRLSYGYIGKAIFTKGKSSAFGPIAADIPVNAKLSKVADKRYNKKSDEEIRKQIHSFQEVNDKALQESESVYTKWKDKINSNTASAFNNLYLMIEVIRR